MICTYKFFKYNIDMEKKVLVIGSANVDQTLFVENFPKEKETIIGNQLITSFGGKGLNQAYALKKAGLDVTFAYAIGDDFNGELISNFVKKCEINEFLFKYDNTSSGHATILVNKSGENKIVIIPGSNYKLSKENIMSFEEKISMFSYVVIQNEINYVTTKFVIETCKKYNVKILYNPAPYIKIDDDLFDGVDFLTPNEIELEQYANKKVDKKSLISIKNAANILLEKGVKNIIVTLGDKGAYFINNSEDFLVESFKVEAVDTVSAGDTFSAYFLFGIINNLSIKNAILLGNKAASITCSRKGSLISIPSIDELK